MKFEAKIRSISLRKQGKSYSEILSIVKVSKSTLSKWLKDFPLDNNAQLALHGRAKSRLAGAKANQAKARDRRDSIFERARAEAAELLKQPLFVAGLMLYWAEGTKNGSTVAFTNSDPKMVGLMMNWFRRYCAVPENKFRVLVFIHSLQVNDDWLAEWSKITGISPRNFIKPYIKPTVTHHRRNKLYNGTCAVRISDVNLLARIKGWLAGASEVLLP